MPVAPAGSVGFTRRAGATRYTHGSITEMLQKYPSSITALDPAAQQPPAGQDQQQPQPQQAAHSTGVTALVFGREESGLTEAELRLCAHACAIPTGRMQASMNLSHAVVVVLCGLFERRLALLGFTENPGLDTRGEDRAGAAWGVLAGICSSCDVLWCGSSSLVLGTTTDLQC
jgi:tRNA(Leu) C34 or U34 (ribose-2'-O)-methylase TrmL